MKATHFIDDLALSREAGEEVTLLKTNSLGDYLLIGKESTSRYQGWFVRLGEKIYKIIENIEIANSQRSEEFYNHPQCFVRKTMGIKEIFSINKDQNALNYQVSQECFIDLILDMRESYKTPQWGRHYGFCEKEDLIIIDYWQEDLEKNIYLAIKRYPKDAKIKKIDKWILRKYSYDEQRNSPPYEAWVYHALRIKTEKLKFGVGFSEEEAINNVYANSTNSHRYSQIDNNDSLPDDKIKDISTCFAYKLARNSLLGLLVYDGEGKTQGLYAGLPWFFQFWSRDEAISLKGLSFFNKRAFWEIGGQLLNSFKNDGYLSNIRIGAYGGAPLESVDSAGWLFFRLGEAILSAKDKDERQKKDFTLTMEDAIQKLLKHHTDNEGLAVNLGLETWMDTQFNGDDRRGARLEIQALRLALYRLAHQMTKNKKYRILEMELQRKTRSYFWNGSYLKDGKDDDLIRSNIFLAYYLYPELLMKKEWRKCFDKALSRLWLSWGGIATIDKNHFLFCERHTGENPKSYHRGDSWFWINNLAAVSMSRLSKRSYLKRIKKIIKASAEDILWHGAIGHHSELSSAYGFKPAGSLAQAWSAATFLELVDELYRP